MKRLAIILVAVLLAGCNEPDGGKTAMLTDQDTGCTYLAELSSDGTSGKVNLAPSNYDRCRRLP